MAVGCVGLFITEDNRPHWALTLLREVVGLGLKNLLYLYFILALVTPSLLIQLVMSASPSTGIVIYKIIDEGSLNYMNHNLSLVVIK